MIIHGCETEMNYHMNVLSYDCALPAGLLECRFIQGKEAV